MNDYLLPSYESATNRDAWVLIAPYIPSADLCAASLVCRKWHEMFVPFLWGAPASHFGSDADAMYVALTRFRRALPRARFWVRCLTHTMRLRPALAEIYGVPKSTWLRDLLEHLPDLQALLVPQLPFFDHRALMALKYKSDSNDNLGDDRGGGGEQEAREKEKQEEQVKYYDLRLLHAHGEPNTTSASLVEGLIHFPRLVYLDLSYTARAKDAPVLAALAGLPHLQVLKLRGIGLRDQNAQILAGAIGNKVRLLDARNNFLTDNVVGFLLQECFLSPETTRRVTGNTATNILSENDGGYPDPPHFEWPRSSANVLSADSLRSEHLDDHLFKQLTTPLTGHTDPEDLPHVGITHLYLAGNDVSVEGLASLLNTGALHVLDGGTVATADAIQNRYQGGDNKLKSVGGENLFITTARFPGASKLVPVLGKEAAGNLTYLRVHHAVITEDGPPDQEEGERTTGKLSTVPDDQRIQQLLHKRPKKSSLLSGRRYLHPSDLPHLRTLVLTDIPASVPSSSPIIQSLIRFITACSEEALLATLQAQSNYSLPPGWARVRAELQHAKSLFALERIVLEITPVRKVDVRKGPSAWMPQGYYNPGAAKSSTGDLDSENLWAAAIDDFSFFRGGDEGGGEGQDEDEEGCAVFVGRGDEEPEKSSRSPHSRPNLHRQTAITPDVDLVQILADFRRSKRLEYERKVNLVHGAKAQSSSSSPVPGSGPVHVEGHWKGEVKVVRNPAPGGGGSGVVDGYGNYFEKGYLYA